MFVLSETSVLGGSKKSDGVINTENGDRGDIGGII